VPREGKLEGVADLVVKALHVVADTGQKVGRMREAVRVGRRGRVLDKVIGSIAGWAREQELGDLHKAKKSCQNFFYTS